MDSQKSTASPDEVLDRDDPGDATQRNFRYQHGYGVILLVGAACGTLPYISIWCEHHEDFLGERPDGLYDAFQIKTGKPENGPWTLTDAPLKDSIKRFIRLDKRFPDKIATFSFVSNLECLDSKAKDKLAFSPFRLLESLNGITTAAEMPKHSQDAFQKLMDYCDCGETDLLTVLRKLRLVKGPGRDSFDAEIAHDHLPSLSECKSLSPAMLNRLRDAFIHVVFRSSSLPNDDPSRHWCCINGEDHLNPALRSKRIPVADVALTIQDFSSCPFRFVPSGTSLKLASGKKELSVLEQKMIKGGLSDFIQMMRTRALSAERHLMELSHLKPDEIESILDQIVAFVEGECDEAHLLASEGGEPYGRKMLLEIRQHLRDAAKDRRDMVHHQEYECLMGVVGLLTEECRVWWSSKFDLKETL